MGERFSSLSLEIIPAYNRTYASAKAADLDDWFECAVFSYFIYTTCASSRTSDAVLF